jgi:transposase
VWLSFSAPIWFYPQPVDFRKQMDGLIILIASGLEKIPTSGELFLFRNRSSNKLKMLWFDRDRFWLFYTRLEGGRFKLPEVVEGAISLSRDQLSWLLSGLDCSRPPVFKEVKATNFY